MGKLPSQGDKSENGLTIEEKTNIEESHEDLQIRKETAEKTKDKIRKTGSLCEVCNKKFRSRYHLKLHSVVHTGEKNYLCGICRKSYQQKWNLITHMARVHGKEKPFKCTDCGKAFGYSSHFKKHIKNHFIQKMKVPEKIKQRILNPYNCEQCQKNFDSKYRLEIHLKKHSDNKPFICDKCGTGFTTKRLVNNHINKYHLGNFICDKCGDSFPFRTAITQHITKVHGMVKSLKKLDNSIKNENCSSNHQKDLIPCEVCGKTVMRASMKKHLNIHYRNRIYSCKFCKKEFLESGQRMVHERRHTGEKPYLCDLCGKSHSQYGNLLAHRRRRHNMKEKPQTKGKKINEMDSFMQAQDRKEENSNQINGKSSELEYTDKTIEEFLMIAGTWINKKFEESKCMKTQIAERLDIESLNLLGNNDSDEKLSEMKEEEKIKVRARKIKYSIRSKNSIVEKVKKQMNCKIFDKILEDLENDMRTKETIQKIVNDSKNGEKDSLKEFLKIMKNIPENKVVKAINGKFLWFCWVCNGKFTSRHILARHLLIHEPKELRPYKCDQCEKTFTQSNNYKEHLMAHTNENQFYCEKCGKGFRHKSHFNVHMKKHMEIIVTETSKNLKCSYCDKTFTTNFYRNEHVRTHTREKPYLCKICGHQFAAISTLTRHSRTHTTPQYWCQICRKLFKHKSSLKRHETIHSQNPNTRVYCECGKTFSQKSSLKKHKMICRQRIEPIVKPFPCVLCSKRFLTKSDFNRHAATHDTSKNFECKVCFIRLKTGETYSRHMRRHKTNCG